MFLIVGFLWKIAIYPLFLIAMVFNDSVQKWVMKISMLIPYYFMASYAAFIGIYVNNGQKSILILIFGGIFLLLHGMMGIVQAQREMEREGSYDYYGLITFRYYGILLGIAFYIYLIFDPRPGVNRATMFVGEIIDWIRGVPILNWFIAAAAFLYVVYAIFMCIVAIIGVTSMAFNRSKNISS